MNNCNNNIVIPTLPIDLCSGKTISTKCLINESAIPSLFLEPNSTQEEVNNALVLAINSLINRVELLETQIVDHENRITTLEP